MNGDAAGAASVSGSQPAQTGERGWRRLLPAVAVFLFVQSLPLRALVPIEQTLLLLVPALAACAWVAWRNGGRIWFALVWTGVAMVALSRPMAGDPSYVAFARGWALVLAAAFGAFGLAFRTKPFFTRAVWTLSAASVLFGVVLFASGVSSRTVERVISAELSDRVESSVASWRRPTTTPEWAELERKSPESTKAIGETLDAMETQMRAIPPFGTEFFPAILLLESLVALGLAWSLHHRLSRTRIGPPIAQLREFRFEDQFIWGIIAGLVLVLIPRFAAYKTIGLNLLLFFGVLYAVRGLAVLAWFLLSPGRWMGLVIVSVFVVLWPFPLSLGLGDTYFDWRRRVRPSNQGSSQ
ncbi:MAG TPA: DUF2232 domain-containing protein [Gemmatimonadaceae bacterium]|nr:DUF2232 domain-containing protein [Gemmatimonadaceae bacterium]